MTFPILRTKLFIPPLRAKVVSRPQLIAKLNEGMDYKLTLLSAPAGFGKTTLVSDWISGCERSVAWLSLDEKDNDLQVFLTYFIVALKSIHEDIGNGVLEALPSLQSVGIEAILTDLINDITEVPFKFILILEDFHVIDNRSIDRSIVFLMDNMPSNFSLVITTRVDPHFPLAKLRARNQLMEIRAVDLRFTHVETIEFFKLIMNLTLSETDVATLENRTEGWIAGMQLVALSMQRRSDATDFIESFSGSHDFIMDYLIEEVLKQESVEIQTFLLQTSILDRFCGSLCDAITLRSSPSGQETLDYLQHANLFIVPLDNERKWYRYHHLFADLLRQRLPNEFVDVLSDEVFTVAMLHLRASEWFEKNRLISEAIEHAILAKDFDRTASLVERAWITMDRNMQSAIWLGWVKRIPEELIHERPVLSAGYAWALLDIGDFEDCEQRLRDAENGMNRLLAKRNGYDDPACKIVIADEEQFRFLPATIESARAYHASAVGDLKATIQHGRKSKDLSEKDDYHGKYIVDTLLGLALWANGELGEAFSTISQGILDDQMEIMVAIVLSEILIEQGRLQLAVNQYEKSIKNSREYDKTYQIPVASFYLGLGKIKLLKGELTEAENLLQHSKELGEKTALPNWRYNWYLLLARIRESQENFDQAMEYLNEAGKYYFRSPIPDVRPFDAIKTRVLLKQGKRICATDWAKERAFFWDEMPGYLHEFESITFVRILISEFSHSKERSLLAEARRIIGRLLIDAKNEDRIGSIIEILILNSLTYEAEEEIKFALESLNDAVHLAESEGYVQIFIDEGPPMIRLLTELANNKNSSNYAQRLLLAIHDQRGLRKNDKTISKAKNGVTESISERELEILRLISQGLTNYEICERLFLALSTVKGYNQNLYGKLQVKNRTEAIARARELKLL